MQQKAQDKWNNHDNLFFTGPNGRPVNLKKLRDDFNAMQVNISPQKYRYVNAVISLC